MTQGYGPEMYVLPAPEEQLRDPCRLLRAGPQSRERPNQVCATITEGWGTPNERTTEKVVALANGKEWHDLATLVAR